MPNVAEVIAVVAAGGALGYLLYKRAQTPAAADPCAGLTGNDLVLCKAAGIAGSLVGLVADQAFTDDQSRFTDERTRRKAVNDQLNGAPDNTLSNDVSAGASGLGPVANSYQWMNPVGTAPFRYANGCQPYYSAPGWTKCGAGTLDMYEMAVQQHIGTSANVLDEAHAVVGQVFETPQALAAATANNQKAHDENDSHWYQVSLGARWDPRPVEKLNKGNYGTGASGDPLTQGPWVDGAGQIWWLVRGKRFTGPTGKVPLVIAMRARGPRVAGQTQADVDATIRALSDAQAVSLIAVGSYGASSGTGVTTSYDCSTIRGSNLTWNPSTSSWRRMRSGETQNLGPCAAPRSGSGAVSHAGSAITLSTLGWEQWT